MISPRGVKGRPILAVPSTGERGGGIGQVCAWLWDVFRGTWQDNCELVPLLPDKQRLPTLVDKVRFGAAMAGRQVRGDARWVLFGHLRLARVQQYVPPIFRAPYAVFLHGVEAWDRFPPADVRAVRGATLRLANSAWTARRARQANPDIGDIVVCPLALPRDLVEVDCNWTHRPSKARIVLMVGRIAAGERYKGHQQLLDAWPTIVAAVPEAELVIAGDGDDRARLEAAARMVPHGDRIRFTGFVARAELERLYSEAAVFAMPSRGEGFGLVYLEAMAHRLPCIGSIHDAATEVIVDGVTGLLVDPDDTRAVAQATIRLLTNEAVRQELGNGGYARLLTEFTFERFSRRVVASLNDALEPVGAGGGARAPRTRLL